MKKFKEYITEASYDVKNIDEVITAIKTMWEKEFSQSIVSFRKNNLGGLSLTVRHFLVNDAKEAENKILQNDHLEFSYNIDGFSSDGSLTDIINFQLYASYMYVKATRIGYAFDTHKFPFRNKNKTNINKVLEIIQGYIGVIKKDIQTLYKENKLVDFDVALYKKKGYVK